MAEVVWERAMEGVSSNRGSKRWNLVFLSLIGNAFSQIFASMGMNGIRIRVVTTLKMVWALATFRSSEPSAEIHSTSLKNTGT